ncbi:hypothetical protein BHM03_00042102 [Ensete ventricosum]|nr:hypothetical protein BHM03_00042102 [Ensete ventricosum]
MSALCSESNRMAYSGSHRCKWVGGLQCRNAKPISMPAADGTVVVTAATPTRASNVLEKPEGGPLPPPPSAQASGGGRQPRAACSSSNCPQCEGHVGGQEGIDQVLEHRITGIIVSFVLVMPLSIRFCGVATRLWTVTQMMPVAVGVTWLMISMLILVDSLPTFFAFHVLDEKTDSVDAVCLVVNVDSNCTRSKTSVL